MQARTVCVVLTAVNRRAVINTRGSIMPKTERTRIDYMPGDAALDALALAEDVFPALRT